MVENDEIGLSDTGQGRYKARCPPQLLNSLAPDYQLEPLVWQRSDEYGPKMAVVRPDFLNEAVVVTDEQLADFSRSSFNSDWKVYVCARLRKNCAYSYCDYVSFGLSKDRD